MRESSTTFCLCLNHGFFSRYTALSLSLKLHANSDTVTPLTTYINPPYVTSHAPLLAETLSLSLALSISLCCSFVGLASSLQQWQAWQLLKLSLRSCTTSFSPWKMMSVFLVFLVHFYVFLIVIMFINYLLCLQGIVDHHFKDCYNLKDANGPFLFIELLTTYISDSETNLEEMTTELYV